MKKTHFNFVDGLPTLWDTAGVHDGSQTEELVVVQFADGSHGLLPAKQEAALRSVGDMYTEQELAHMEECAHDEEGEPNDDHIYFALEALAMKDA